MITCQEPTQLARRVILRTFGPRLVSAYLIGSHAAGLASPDGDMDVVALSTGLSVDEQSDFSAKAVSLFHYLSGCRLDLNVREKAEILKNGCEYVRLSGIRLHGEDLRFSIPLPSAPVYMNRLQRNAIRASQNLSQQLRDESGVEPRTFRDALSASCRLQLFRKLGVYTAQKNESVEIMRATGNLPEALYQNYFIAISSIVGVRTAVFQPNASVIRCLVDYIDKGQAG